jgi:capsular polysaccharide transport system permease protein
MSATTERLRHLSTFGLLKAQANVLHALMMRDIRTRMFGSALGFIIVIAWPISHVLLLVLVNTGLGRVAPFGDSMALWCATGLVPFMSFSYMSRFMMFGVVLNKPLLFFPAISVTDILIARAIVEMLSAFVVIVILLAIFAGLGIDFHPIDVVQACYAMLAAMLLGLGAGILYGIVSGFSPSWLTAFTLVNIFLWMTSGILFVPDSLPESVRNVLFYHPVLHTIEWMRTAYYEGYSSSLLAKWYPLTVGVSLVFVGLAVERFFRGRLLI